MGIPTNSTDESVLSNLVGISTLGQQAIRKMSDYPRQPRVFSQAKILIPGGAIFSILAVVILIFGDLTGRILFYAVVLLLVSLTLLAHGIWRRFGVDRDKVWTKFGPWFYREVHFSGITRFEGGIQRFKLYEGGTMVNVDYQRFDYALVYLRLLEELQKRRFGLPGVGVDSPNWDMAAQQWRQTLVLRLYKLHKKFYDTHPDELARVNSLSQTPTSYAN